MFLAHRYEGESKGSYLNKDMVYTNTPDTGIDLSVNKIEGEVEKDA